MSNTNTRSVSEYKQPEKLQTYPAKTAGHVMIKEYPVAGPADSIKHIKELITQKVNWLKTVNYIYIVDDENVLLGVLSIKELFRKDDSTIVSSVMNKELVSVQPVVPQEKVAYLAMRNSIKEVPVTSKDGVILGVITSDTIFNITYKEAREDLMLYAGLKHSSAVNDDVMALPITTSVMHRLPWLLLGMLGGLMTAQVISKLNFVFQEYLILASFIPMLTYMAGAVGAQVQVFLVRDLASTTKVKIFKYFWRQLLIVVSIAFIASLLLFSISYILYRESVVSHILGIALFSAVMSALVIGVFVPYTFFKMKIDPANAGGPIGTVMQDFLSVLLYLSIAALLVG